MVGWGGYHSTLDPRGPEAFLFEAIEMTASVIDQLLYFRDCTLGGFTPGGGGGQRACVSGVCVQSRRDEGS